MLSCSTISCFTVCFARSVNRRRLRTDRGRREFRPIVPVRMIRNSRSWSTDGYGPDEVRELERIYAGWFLSAIPPGRASTCADGPEFRH